jgi:hypothetical protein
MNGLHFVFFGLPGQEEGRGWGEARCRCGLHVTRDGPALNVTSRLKQLEQIPPLQPRPKQQIK